MKAPNTLNVLTYTDTTSFFLQRSPNIASIRDLIQFVVPNFFNQKLFFFSHKLGCIMSHFGPMT